MGDLFEFSVEWPSTSAQSVIVTGDFDQWSRSKTLLRSSTNNHFTGTIKVPYGCPTRYKFIVDGEWKVRQGEPTELSPEGYLNNIYYVPVKDPLPKSSTGPNGTLASYENGNTGATDTRNDKLNAATEQAEATTATTSSPPMDQPTDVPVPVTSEPTTSPTNDAVANPESNGTESPNVALAPIIPIPIVPVNAKENCTIDPSKAVSNEDSIGTFVGVRLPPKEDDKKVDEEKKEEGTVNGAVELPDTSPPVIEAPKEPPTEPSTEEAVKTEQTSAAEPASDEKTMAPAPEPVTAVKTEEDVPQSNQTEEPKKEDEPKKAEEPQPEASSATPTPDATQATPKSPSRFVEGANANGHTNAATSDTSTAVKPTSSPTTSSTAPGTTLAESMTSGGSSAPGNKTTAPVPEQKSAPSGVNNGDTKEFGVKEGKGSMKSGKKKRTNSIFGKLKRIFHGDKHKTNGSA